MQQFTCREVIIQFNPTGQTHRPATRIMSTDVGHCAFLCVQTNPTHVTVLYCNLKQETVKALIYRREDVFEVSMENMVMLAQPDTDKPG